VTADQVSGFFDAGESFIEGTIAAALVILWILAVALHLARPYMVRTTGKFTLRLGADLWWIIYVAVRDLILLQVFLGSFIFLYPDVVSGQPLPITGGIAAVFAFAALVIKLIGKADGDLLWMRIQITLIGLGAVLYLVPYFLGSQMTLLTGHYTEIIRPMLVTSLNPDVALPLCYLSAALIGILGVIAVGYNLRQTARRPQAVAQPQPAA
jgi:hypothetical protein